MNVISALRKVVLTPDGTRFVDGAQSRLAEMLTCSRTTVKRYFLPDAHGELWIPGEEKMRILRDLVKNNWTPFSLKRGPIAQLDGK